MVVFECFAVLIWGFGWVVFCDLRVVYGWLWVVGRVGVCDWSCFEFAGLGFEFWDFWILEGLGFWVGLGFGVVWGLLLGGLGWIVLLFLLWLFGCCCLFCVVFCVDVDGCGRCFIVGFGCITLLFVCLFVVCCLFLFGCCWWVGLVVFGYVCWFSCFWFCCYYVVFVV